MDGAVQQEARKPQSGAGNAGVRIACGVIRVTR